MTTMDAKITYATHEPTLVIRANGFTSTIDDGYLMRNGRKVGETMNVVELAQYIIANPKTRVDYLRT
jgi:hypothetical protein